MSSTGRPRRPGTAVAMTEMFFEERSRGVASWSWKDVGVVGRSLDFDGEEIGCVIERRLEVYDRSKGK